MLRNECENRFDMGKISRNGPNLIIFEIWSLQDKNFTKIVLEHMAGSSHQQLFFTAGFVFADFGALCMDPSPLL